MVSFKSNYKTRYNTTIDKVKDKETKECFKSKYSIHKIKEDYNLNNKFYKKEMMIQ